MTNFSQYNGGICQTTRKMFQTDNEFNPNEATNQKERKENTEKPKPKKAK